MNHNTVDTPQEDEAVDLNTLLKKGKFEKGTISLDTTYTEIEILRFNRRNRNNAFLYCIVRDSTSNVKLVKAEQIDGYTLGEECYKSHHSDNEFFFIKLSKEGRVNLYERNSIPDDNRFLFYLKLEGYNEYIVISPLEEKFTMKSFAGTGGEYDTHKNTSKDNLLISCEIWLKT